MLNKTRETSRVALERFDYMQTNTVEIDASFGHIITAPLQILIVEDMKGMGEAISRKLMMLRAKFPDAKITHVGTLTAGLEVVHQVPYPDITLLDLGLPDSKWEATIERIDEFEKRSPVIVVTGHPSEQVRKLIALTQSPEVEVLFKDADLFGKLFEAIARAMTRGKTGSMERVRHNIRQMRELIDSNASSEA